jgi:hypothetical protein
MSELSVISGVNLEQVEREGIRYTYPLERVPIEHLVLATELSSAHAIDPIVKLVVNPECYPAQGSYFLSGQPQSPEFITGMGNVIHESFGDMLAGILDNPKKVETLKRMAEHLENGDNIANWVPHGPLLDIGLQQGLVQAGLSSLGASFRSGIVISQGVTGLGLKFNKELDPVPLATALSWASNKVWFVFPRTENAQESEFARVVPAEQIDRWNRVVRADIEAEQDEGGILITVAPSATSYKEGPNGEKRLVAATPGTVKMFAKPNTYVSQAVGAFLGAEKPSYYRSPELSQLSGAAEELLEQSDAAMQEMTNDLNREVPDSAFDFLGRIAREELQE